MQKKGCLFLFLFFYLPTISALGFTVDKSSVSSVITEDISATMAAERAPIVTSILGTTLATLDSMFYPSFYDAQPSSDPYVFNCGEHLKKDVSGRETANSNFVLIDGLKKTITIPPELINRCKILFTWTVRIETATVTTPVESLCSAWTVPTTHSDYTFFQRLAGGQVETQLFINNIAQNPIATMTIPGLQPVDYIIPEVVAPTPTPNPCCYSPGLCSCECLGTCTGYEEGDPTLTGSCLVSASDFPKGILNVELRWLNKMYGFQAVSQENMRQLIITIIPDK